jgi:hypothetical protein
LRPFTDSTTSPPETVSELTGAFVTESQTAPPRAMLFDMPNGRVS